MEDSFFLVFWPSAFIYTKQTFLLGNFNNGFQLKDNKCETKSTHKCVEILEIGIEKKKIAPQTISEKLITQARFEENEPTS